MVKIKGFEKAYQNMLAIDAMNRINKKRVKRKIEELVSQGIDEEVAKAMAKCGLLDKI